jgi:chromosomal replication initiation ATPase DnaA
LIAYLTRRIERSFTAAADVIARLDAAAWREKSPITVAFARDVLAQNGDQSASPISDAGVT